MAQGQGRHTTLRVHLTAPERQALETWQRTRTRPAGQVRRARLILLVAQGLPLSQVARRVGLNRRFVYKWVRRYQHEGIAGLVDRPKHDPVPRRWLAEAQP